ncbi:hypothetical protein N7532_004665 [Penicillium argentinense]|uniref:CBF1-interacting co-repressor CIR N-terminal domain-containing protein n=1 Tax=Penicillium argentinense TaxID=1131581 RepID=A0A9W9FPL9_9EURO|nr:uncharacterized protein N7532_004665 [Penicillium argentinense]KAJ5104136.1 hypothetical protein N7532_004665 [Penicillium argentinense]
MPLHLLGKKSWNVYRPENIARVKRDEAQAKAREEEDERRMQEVDAERRIKILRGERPPTPPPPPPAQSSNDASARPERKNTDYYGRYRKRRRLSGEDDTDRDIRMAREDAEQAVSKREELTRSSRPDSEAPLVDSKGHINLFPESKGKTSKNAEAEAEAKKMERSYEDQYTMRFSNAEGFKEHTGRQPWYSSGAQALAAPNAMPDKNVWGNEDPRRQDREQARMLAKDPLAAMKRGVRQLKATQEERKRLNEEKQKELEALKYEERHGSQHHRYHRQKRSRSRDIKTPTRVLNGVTDTTTEIEVGIEAGNVTEITHIDVADIPLTGLIATVIMMAIEAAEIRIGQYQEEIQRGGNHSPYSVVMRL